jgi:hypothetical protein
MAKQRITFEQLEVAIESDESIGFCLACGAEQSGVEPDARRYPCEVCNELRVYGAQEILVRIA